MEATLQYCIGFAIHQHESATGAHMFPILNPAPTTLPMSFSFSISPSNEHSGGFLLGLTGLIALQSKGCSRVFSNTTVHKHQFFSAQLSSQFNSHIHT